MYYIIGKTVYMCKYFKSNENHYKVTTIQLDTALNKKKAERLVKKHQKELGDEWVVIHRKVGGMQI